MTTAPYGLAYDPDFAPLECSGLLSLTAGSAGVIATLRPSYGHRFLRLTYLTYSNNQSASTANNPILDTDVGGLAQLSGTRLSAGGGMFAMPLFFDLAGDAQGSFTLTNPLGVTMNSMFRLDGFFHNGRPDPLHPAFCPPRDAIPFAIAGNTAAPIGNLAEGRVLAFTAPRIGDRIRIWGFAQVCAQTDPRGFWRFIGPGLEHLADTVYPVPLSANHNEGMIHPVHALLRPGMTYEIRHFRQVLAGGADYGATLLGYGYRGVRE